MYDVFNFENSSNLENLVKVLLFVEISIAMTSRQ